MPNRIKVEICPMSHYCKNASSDYILCCINFYLYRDGEEYHFQSMSSDKCIDKLLKDIDGYLLGKLPSSTQLSYYMPCLLGEKCIYSYSFKVKDFECWSFRYKQNEKTEQYDFECDLGREEIISMQNQLKTEISRIDWNTMKKRTSVSYE